jgi:predicted anti-sigma-YlaC factor YlaD
MNAKLSCKKAAELLSQAQDEPLSVLDRVRLKFHLSICPNCQEVKLQMAQLTNLMRNPLDMDEVIPDDASHNKSGGI